MRRPGRWTNERRAVACLTALGGGLLIWALIQPGPPPAVCIPMAAGAGIGAWFTFTGRLPAKVARNAGDGLRLGTITARGDRANLPAWTGLVALTVLAALSLALWLILF